jgi:hypothetical protein
MATRSMDGGTPRGPGISGKKKGSSHFSGEGGLDFQEEVG